MWKNGQAKDSLLKQLKKIKNINIDDLQKDVTAILEMKD